MLIFIHDGWQIVISLKNGVVQDRYLWGAKQDELLCSNSAWTLTDHLGTIRDIVDGDKVSHFEYNAFGRMLEKAGDADCRFKYTGKFYDDVVDLQWNINRWYDPKVGRWASEDPIGFEANDGNLYRYVLNASILKTDPSGLLIWSTFDTDTSVSQPFKVTQYWNSWEYTEKHKCRDAETALMNALLGAVGYVFAKSPGATITFAVGAGFCECEAQIRYKRYKGHEWYGKWSVGWSLIQGYVYDYYYRSSGPTVYGAYAMEWNMYYKNKYGGTWLDNGWQTMSLTSATEAEVKESAEWYQWPTYSPNAWTGWISP